ncbi:polysialyltransferase family glycosyltransferase [Streptomyces gamaensis]|uniref:Polysialyltransferase family glycosyltransferase n=1 Tax=Streptomyces gamaensis TaxID=1763542 RepID=A0ABW0YY94_9ACTN
MPTESSPRTHVFLVSTLYGTATLAAALDAGCFPDAERRLLLVANTSAVPEAAPPLDEAPGFERLHTRFDGVLGWNAAVAPCHPGGWQPRPDDVPLWERHLRLLWGLGDARVTLVVESLQVPPALALAQVFADADLEVYADGLMSYGPTRVRLDPLIGVRVRRLLYPDLVPGLAPLLLAEFGTVRETVPAEAMTKVLAELADAAPLTGVPEGSALLLGQYLSALGILTAEEEEGLHVALVRGAAARGHRSLVFKPHPSAPAAWTRTLSAEAEALGAELTVLDAPVLAEAVFQQARPALVAGCFSTALLTARTLYGLPVARTGTRLVLERLSPYQNSNRVPVVLVDALVPDLDEDAPDEVPPGGEELCGLLAAVGFTMQPGLLPEWRRAAERHLAGHLTPGTRHRFSRRRLTVLGLPGGVLPPPLARLPRHPALRQAARYVRALKRRLARRLTPVRTEP